MRRIPSLLEFATQAHTVKRKEMRMTIPWYELTKLLAKERAKCLRQNKSETHHTLDKECALEDLTKRKMLSRMMPPRYTWARPGSRKRKKLKEKTACARRLAEEALMMTIERDRNKPVADRPGYLTDLDAFCERIVQRLTSDELSFETPKLTPILKDKEPQPDGTLKVTCRPLTVYTRLEDKIILGLVSRYLTVHFDRYLHRNILSYRKERRFYGKEHHVTDFNDGIELIRAFREAHPEGPIYAADCDIKKFYDTIHHQVVLDCFDRLFDRANVYGEDREQVMHVLRAYLASFNFYDNAWLAQKEHPEVFSKVRKRLHDKTNQNTYSCGWVEDILGEPEAERRQRGVSQGGALSLPIANIVLNDVDRQLVEKADSNRLFVRFCDDMILLHTDYDECCRLMQLYTESLVEHQLYCHPSKLVEDCDHKGFWGIKSHDPFLWGEGSGNCNRYIGFLGFEMRRDGRIRLRKSNIDSFKDKFRRKRHQLFRQWKDLSFEDYLERKDKMLSELVDNSLKHYKALDKELFKRGKQNGLLNHARKRAKRLLPSKPFKPKHFPTSSHISKK